MQAQWPTAAPPPVTYHQQAQPQQNQHQQPTTLEEVRTLWIGDLQYWADESYLTGCFAHTGELISIKIIRNKITGHPEGYGFIEFTSHAAAERILQSYNGIPMPGTEQPFRLNWASFGLGEKRADAGPDHSIFVGDLAPDVTDYMLQETFRVQYPSVRGAKVVTDVATGRSKGYGFVKFGDEMEKNRAMSEMNGVYCSSRPMRISAATAKKPGVGVGVQPYPAAVVKATYPGSTYAVAQLPAAAQDNDITNTTIFVGGIDPNLTEDELRPYFSPFGEITYAKVHPAKACAFVQFRDRASAEEAIQRMNGTMIGQQTVRVSWGRTSNKDQSGAWGSLVDPTQWAAYYGYGYDPYGYAAVQDPSLYAYGAYAGYGQYPQQVEVAQDMNAMTGVVSTVENKEELYDPLVIPDVDKLNDAYVAVHANTVLGRTLWFKTSTAAQQA